MDLPIEVTLNEEENNLLFSVLLAEYLKRCLAYRSDENRGTLTMHGIPQIATLIRKLGYHLSDDV